MHTHKTTYTHGDMVFLKTDPAQLKRMVVSFSIKPEGAVVYELACGEGSSYHLEIEISNQEDTALKMGLNKINSQR